MNKVVLITGGAQRIGASTARVLHEREMNVIVHYRNSKAPAQKLVDSLNAKRPNSAAFLQADLLLTDQLATLIEQAVQIWGRFDVLVNNASTFYPTRVGQATLEHWDDLMGTNAKAPFFLSQAAYPYLKESQGCIVNMVDIHALRPLKEHPVYCAAKASLVMITQSLAREFGPAVRVNAVAPGAILWPENDMNDATKQDILQRIALRRQGDPQDIARAIAYLVQDASYTTGHILKVDGGRSLYC